MLNYSCRPINYTSHRTLLINGIRTKNILDNFTFTITVFFQRPLYFQQAPSLCAMYEEVQYRKTDGRTYMCCNKQLTRRPSFLSIFIFTEDNVTKTTYHYSP